MFSDILAFGFIALLVIIIFLTMIGMTGGLFPRDKAFFENLPRGSWEIFVAFLLVVALLKGFMQ